jgi:hypothetical protein
MTVNEFSLVPKGYREKDPRPFAWLYPKSINIVSYAKSMQKFAFYQALEVAEDLAKRQGFILLPWSCIHWQRAQSFGIDRKVKIGRKSYFLMKPQELTKSETMKLEKYLEELHEVG